MSNLAALRAYAWSMTPLPGMPGDAPLNGRGTCESCSGGTYKGRSVCRRCEKSQEAAARRAARRAARVSSVQSRPPVSCWICARPMISHGAERPTCKSCRQEYGSGVCSKCGGPKRLAKPGLCRACRPVRPEPAPRVCDLCGETYVPKYAPKPGKQQCWCSKSCTTAWRNGARPPYVKQATTGVARKVALARARRLRHAQTWDGIPDEEILERDGWRCQIPGCKRRPIRKDLKYPHLRSKSIDHIVPLSLGGDDTAVNKRAAHLGCNTARGNEMGDEQVALFGSIREPPLATVTANERALLFQRKRRTCACGAVPLKGRKFCQGCLDRRAAEAAERAEKASSTPVHYYTCRYCGELKVARCTSQLREVCPGRPCQLARLQANNLRVRNGMTREEADAVVTTVVAGLRSAPKTGRGRPGGPEAAARRLAPADRLMAEMFLDG